MNGFPAHHRQSVWQMIFCLITVVVILASLWVFFRSRPAWDWLNGVVHTTVISSQTGNTEQAKQPISVLIRMTDEPPEAYAYYDSALAQQMQSLAADPPENSLPVYSQDLSGKPGAGELLIHNQTGYAVKTDDLLSMPVSLSTQQKSSDDPVILIVHTHGTECYRSEVGLWYTQDEAAFRSEDITQNVVAVGAVMQEVFAQNGLSAIHCTVMHDAESYADSYAYAARTIRQYLKEYPSIRYVFDIHRDAISDGKSGIVRCVTDADGQPTAQVMCVVGTDEKGAAHPYWRSNLALALQLQGALNEKYETLARPISLRGAAYNQSLTRGSLLIEIGSTGNTIEEAKRAARLTAQALSDIIGGN